MENTEQRGGGESKTPHYQLATCCSYVCTLPTGQQCVKPTHVTLIIKLCCSLLLLLNHLQELTKVCVCVCSMHQPHELSCATQHKGERYTGACSVPIEPLMLSSTSLIIWKSSSSVGFCPMAASKQRVVVRCVSGCVCVPGDKSIAQQPSCALGVAVLTLKHLSQLPYINGSTAILIKSKERIPASIDLLLRQWHDGAAVDV